MFCFTHKITIISMTEIDNRAHKMNDTAGGMIFNFIIATILYGVLYVSIGWYVLIPAITSFIIGFFTMTNSWGGRGTLGSCSGGITLMFGTGVICALVGGVLLLV